MKLLHLDVETSSLSPTRGAVLELAAIPIVNGEEAEPLHLNLQPFANAVVEDGALEVNGIERATLFSAPRLLPGEGFNALLDFLGKYVDPYAKSDKFFFVAYNAGFDLWFLEEMFKRAGNRWFGSYFHRPPICTYALSAFHLGADWAKMKNRKLGTVAKRLGIPLPEEGSLHSALYDARLSQGIYDLIHRHHTREGAA